MKTFSSFFKTLTLILILLATSVSAWGATAELENGQYVYFDISSNTGWASDDAAMRFNWYWNSGDHCCWNNGTKIDGTNIYYATTQNAYTRGVQMLRMSSNYGTQYNYSAMKTVSSRSSDNQNCVKLPTNGWDNCTLTWGTYVPPMNNVTIANNGTTITSGSGTQADPYIIAGGATVKVKATADLKVPDPSPSIRYKFSNDGGSSYNTESTTNTYTFTAAAYSTSAKTYTVMVSSRAAIDTTYNTAKPSSKIYFKVPAQYTVTFNANGHGTAPSSQKVLHGAKAQEPTAPTTAGYTFGGWYKESGCTNKYDFNTAVTGNLTLYAQWKEQTFHLAGSMNGWNTSSNPMTISDGKATCTLTLAKGQYDFKIVESGETWRTASTTPRTINRNSNNLEFKTKGGSDNNTTITADVEGTADYVFNYDIANEKLTVTYPAAYTVTYGVGTTKGTTSVTTNPSITSGALVLASTSITFSKGETKAGYQWKNWNSKADGSGTDLGTGDTYVSSNREADIVVYACYDLITYNITYNLNGGSGTISPTTYNVESATITLPTDLTKTGHTFAGWYDNESFSGTAVTQITNGSTGNKTFYAKWTLNTYTVKWYVNGEELTGAATTVNHGGKVTTIPEVDLNTYCEGSDVLAGWTTAPMENASVKAPAQLYKTIDDFPTAEGPQTYYAVFANYKE